MMRTPIVAFTICLLFHTSASLAADPRTTKQIQQLQQQVTTLQQELRMVRALINVAKDGTTFIRAKQHRQEVTGGNAVSKVSADQRTEVGRSQFETIGINQSISVGTNQSIRVGKDMTLQVGKNLAETVATNHTMTSGKQIVITANDQITLKIGKTSMIMKKNGDIFIAGKNVRIKGAGDVTIKGKKVANN